MFFQLSNCHQFIWLLSILSNLFYCRIEISCVSQMNPLKNNTSSISILDHELQMKEMLWEKRSRFNRFKIYSFFYLELTEVMVEEKNKKNKLRSHHYNGGGDGFGGCNNLEKKW
ncbi:hypothetical protein DERP_001723 [Dermatophagoides pteronyssinus]|uniref:Uncharacterized protein n=1 Tax=Dermatophagoides pteronyssinus TaxID=6956 RepID=A0ABQ8JBW1_DERPT|nr:hypothetical protein DERP_001723 [Dermatophagoides pteronyssinus]